METKFVEIHLPYFKQGDDLRGCLKDAASVADSLEQHALLMDGAARQLRAVKNLVNGQPVTVQVDTHSITMAGPPALMDRLVAEGLAWEDKFDDEDDSSSE